MAGLAMASDYPAKPVKLIVPYPPGGALDLHGRLIASSSHPYFSQPFVISNVSGAAGAVGAAEVARSKTDGYTLLVGNVATCTYKPLSEKLPYSKEGFVPIAQISASPGILGVNASSPYKELKDFIEKAKKEPGALKYSTAGVYSSGHVPSVLFAQKAGIKIKHVPYSGGGPALTALLGNHVDLNINFPSTFSASIQGGLVRPLAITGDHRLKAYPNIPTLKEMGMDVEAYHWISILAPKGTPEPIVLQLREVFKKLCADKTFITMMEKMGEEVRYQDSPDFAKFWAREWKEISDLFASGVMTQ